MPSHQQQSRPSLVFGCLLTASSSGQQQPSDDGFLRAIIRYSRFEEIHLFVPLAQLAQIKLQWASYCQRYGGDKLVRFLPAHEMHKYFAEVAYQVFHHFDPWIGHLAALRDSCCRKPFPVTGRACGLSSDTTLSKSRELLLSPLRRCDALLCHSQAQQKVMMRLLSAASASIFDQLGVTVSFKGAVVTMPNGVEPDECTGHDVQTVRKALGIKPEQSVILTPGDISPAYRMDLQPLLLVINDLVEGYGHRNIQWVIAGAGDAGNPVVQALLKQAYELNLESSVRFELDIDEQRMRQWLSACDLMLTLADSVNDGPNTLLLEAMANGKAVVSSNWSGHGELLEESCLIETMSANMDHLVRPVGTLLADHAHLMLAQGNAVNVSQCAQAIDRLLSTPELRAEVGEQNRRKVVNSYRWESVIEQYHHLVNTLDKDVGQIPGSNKRPVGLPYHQVFRHLPSRQLDDSARLITTDRGVRVLLKSEKFYRYAEMDGLLKPELIDDIARYCLSGSTVATLKAEFSHDPSLMLNICWMCKYQLLARGDELSPVHSQQRWWPQEQRLPADIMARLQCPEPRRFRLLEPLLCWLDQQLLKAHKQPENPELRASLLAFFAAKLDEQLLQALGWVGELRKTRQYSDILDDVLARGGLPFLSNTFPLWYRLNRLLVVGALKDLNRLFRRVYQDINDINQLFAGCWQKPLTAVERVDFPLTISSAMIAIITGDNGEKLVYKNRDLRIEQQIIGHTDDHSNIAGQLNRWLQGQPGLATMRILPRAGGYGYCQFIDASDHLRLNEQQADAYYQRLGVIAGLAILLGLGDVHNRNVISNAGVPYLVDVKNAFSSGVIRAFEAELNDPRQAFRTPGNSFEKTGLPAVFESFHFSRFRQCRFGLHKGELTPLPPTQESLVSNNWLRVGDQHSLSGDQPSLCGQYAGSVEKGLASVFRAVLAHLPQWVGLLQGCQGLSVCHLQRYDRQLFGQQFADLWTFRGFQYFSRARRKDYFTRLTTRLCQSEEEIQRWSEPPWFEPAARLSGELAQALLSGRVMEFRRVLGAQGLFVESNKSNAPTAVSDDYFAVDTLDKAIELCCAMAGDAGKTERYLAFLTAVVKQWLQEQARPGRGFPEALRKRLPG